MADTADAADVGRASGTGGSEATSRIGTPASAARLIGLAALSRLSRLGVVLGAAFAKAAGVVRDTSGVWEKVVTSVLMVVMFIALLFITLDAINMLFSASSCSAGCDYYQFTFGWVLAMIGPSIAFLPSIGLAISLMLQGRLSFWVPMVGFALAMLLRWAGTSLMLANVSQTYGF